MSEMTLEFKSPTIAVVGSQSMVGSRFCETAKEKYQLIQADLNGNIPVDLTKPDTIEALFKNHDFSYIILFSAFTDVDAAESQKGDKNGICWKINVDGVRDVVENCKKFNRHLIFVSTDFVFDGKNGPYAEDEASAQDEKEVSWYGLTKIEGEKIIRDNLENYLILRIAYPYRAYFEAKDDFFRKILKSYKDGKLYPMFSDQKLTPTFIDDIFPAIDVLIENKLRGIFHVASPTVTSPYEIAKKLIATFGGDSEAVKPGSIIDFLSDGQKTPRPINGGLRVDKIIKLGFNPTSWDKGIEKVHEQSPEGELA